MKTKVQIEGQNKLDFPLKRKISKIVNLLFENDIIEENSAINGLGVKEISFGLVFCNDEEIKNINRDYRKKDSATDVITFALFADDENKFVFDNKVELGEIIISTETAKRQAKEAFEKEIYTLITHGILHLLGFDHLTDEDYNFVVSVQNSVVPKL